MNYCMKQRNWNITLQVVMIIPILLYVSRNEIIDLIDKTGETIDVCFTKVKMRSMSGIQIAHKLREKNGRIKIVFISDTDEYALDAWQCGINDYLLEPITKEKVQQSINNL